MILFFLFRFSQIWFTWIAIKNVEIGWTKSNKNRKKNTQIQTEICKTIIVKGQGGKFYGALLKGNDLIDFKKLDKIIGLKPKIADPNEVNEVTSQSLGSLCPIILKIPIFIDHQVLDLEKINFGSGNLSYGIEISVKDLVRIIEFKIVDISKEQIRKGNK